jgi:hypothetical protein
LAVKTFDVDVGLSVGPNLDLQDWLEDAADQARSGAIEVVQDDVAVRIDAGGTETPL